jgi:uncharacterized protein (TIGR03435 family)
MKTDLWVALALAGTFGAHTVVAQTPGAESSPAFAVASVKPSPPPPGDRPFTVRPGVIVPGDRWQVSFSPIYIFLRFIYGPYMGPGQIVGLPDWARTQMYDIEARADGDVSREQMMVMIQNLMKERFKLAVHTEKRDLVTYTLVLARSDGRLGPGLRPPAVDCAARTAALRRGETPPTPPIPAGFQAACDRRVGRRAGLSYLTAAQTGIGGLAAMLQNSIGGPIVDRTGLTALFDIVLEFAPNTALSADPDSPQIGPSVLTAVQDQLGLKLVQEKAPTDVLVIDHIEKAEPN